VDDALMDLVTYPLARGREDGDSGLFYAALPERIIIVFTLAPDLDPDGFYRVGLVDIDYA
jgi:hypothetical protein